MKENKAFGDPVRKSPKEHHASVIEEDTSKKVYHSAAKSKAIALAKDRPMEKNFKHKK